MKLFDLSIPILISMLFFISPAPDTAVEIGASIDNITVAALDQSGKGKKGHGTIVAEQDFTNCNTCAACTEECINSPGACAGATISVQNLYCPFYSPIGSISFPGNSQYICSITQTGIYEWYVEFNVVQYSCDRPDTPFTFDIPVLYSYTCPSTNNTSLTTNLNFIIC